MSSPDNPVAKLVESPTGAKKEVKDAVFEYIPVEALFEIAKVYSHGEKKYGDARNWEKGMEWGKAFSALMRHAWAFWRGERINPDEGGRHHLAHAAFWLLALLQYDITNTGIDTRSKMNN